MSTHFPVTCESALTDLQVIVGGGTAGLAIANRLSASGTHTVAIIEAGSFYERDNGNVSEVPRYAWNGAGNGFEDVNPLVDWMFETEPEKGIDGVKIHYPRGKTLGGSSARNFMVYQRPTSGSLEKWARAVGDERYEWQNFRRYFDRSVMFNKVDATKRPTNSTPWNDPTSAKATHGPVQISYANYVVPFTSWVLKAAEALGMKRLSGFLDGELLGSGWHMQTTYPESMLRDSSETAYLKPVLNRANLVVYHSTMALKLLFEGTEAVGVACDTAGKGFSLRARREVILSAGAIQSPQLLMVSGIGPRDVLEKHDIRVMVDAPGVGQGLEDHPVVGTVHKVRVESSTVLDTDAKVLAATASFLDNGNGPLSSVGIDVFGWEKLPRHLLSNDTLASLDSMPSDWPDVEYMTLSPYPGPPPDGDDYVGVFAVLVNAFSRGSISIRSASMLDTPVINVNFVTDSRDEDMAIAAIRRTREIATHPSLSPIVVPDSESVPGKAAQTDAEVLQWIRASAKTLLHASGTCKMGGEGDATAVVDSEGMVFGTKRLRVVDLSAVPFLPPGHPVSTVYALAEMASEAILQAQ